MTAYKQTELGLIPSDWEVVELGTILTIKHGKSQKNVENQNGIYPILATGGQIGWANSFLYDKPSVLIGRKGTIDKPRYQETPFWTVDTLFYSEINSANLAKFVFYKFCMIDWLKNNEATGVPSQNAKTIEKIIISLPPKPEQTAIATALSDTDALLAELEKLLAKKHAIKTATMQQLLTGKTRLPEFAHRADGTPKGSLKTEWGDIPEDWEVVALGDVGNTYAGLTGKNKDDFGIGNCFYVPFTNVMANIEVNINQLDKVNVNEKQNSVLKNDLLFNGSSETPEEICFSSLVNFDIPNLYLNSFCFGFRVFNLNKIHAKYLAYWFRSNIGRKTVAFMAQGSTRYNISKSEFLKLQIIVPQKPEQTAIAQILGDMDSEITALQAQIEKLREIKQGMMQNLLTGKIRLPF